MYHAGLCEISDRFSRRNGETELASTRGRPFKRLVVHERGELPLS